MGEFVISSCDASKMLVTVKEALDQIALTVQGAVITTLSFAVLARWNDCLGSAGPDAFDKGVRVIPLVGDDRFRLQSFNQILRARNIGNLSFGKDQSQRSTQCLRSAYLRAPAEC